MPNCSICGIAGHNKRTCGKFNNTMPKSSAFYGDYKQVYKTTTIIKATGHAK